MTMGLRVVSLPDGGWTVALDEQSLAGFYGPDARVLAESHRDGLVELLTAATQRAFSLEPTLDDVRVH